MEEVWGVTKIEELAQFDERELAARVRRHIWEQKRSAQGD